MEATATEASQRVGLSLEGPRPVRRLTVAFRIILAIPHFLYLIVLWIVAFFASIAAWVGALVVGRMPAGLGEFLGRVLQYSTRVSSYLYLLTDTYPPFSLAAEEYPVTVLLPAGGKLNRATVFFRLIIAIPAGIVVTLVSSGLQLALLIIWLIVLISGRMPTSVFEAEAAFLRYQTRLYAWVLMLTSEYPSGLFGDGPAVPDPTAGEPGGLAADLQPPDLLPADLPSPDMPTAAPRISRIVLSKGGRRLMVFFLVLGGILLVANIVVAIVNGGQSTEAARNLDRDYAAVVVSSREFGAAVQGCGLSGGPECVHTADRDFAKAVRKFRTDLSNDKFPALALSAADDLRDDATELIGILDQMVETSDATAYRDLALRFQTAGTKLDTDYRDLRDLLTFGG